MSALVSLACRLTLIQPWCGLLLCPNWSLLISEEKWNMNIEISALRSKNRYMEIGLFLNNQSVCQVTWLELFLKIFLFLEKFPLSIVFNQAHQYYKNMIYNKLPLFTNAWTQTKEIENQHYLLLYHNASFTDYMGNIKLKSIIIIKQLCSNFWRPSAGRKVADSHKAMPLFHLGQPYWSSLVLKGADRKSVV